MNQAMTKLLARISLAMLALFTGLAHAVESNYENIEIIKEYTITTEDFITGVKKIHFITMIRNEEGVIEFVKLDIDSANGGISPMNELDVLKFSRIAIGSIAIDNIVQKDSIETGDNDSSTTGSSDTQEEVTPNTIVNTNFLQVPGDFPHTPGSTSSNRDNDLSTTISSDIRGGVALDANVNSGTFTVENNLPVTNADFLQVTGGGDSPRTSFSGSAPSLKKKNQDPDNCGGGPIDEEDPEELGDSECIL